VPVDHSAAHATFIELSFGVNTLFAAYRDLQQRFQVSLSAKVAEGNAKVQAQERQSGTPARARNVGNALTKISSQHINSQHLVQRTAIVLSVLFAILAVFILYCDWLDLLGRWLWILILPFPAFCVFYFANYRTFVIRRWWMLRNFFKFVQTYEKPTLPFDD
jgi:hypothetical protein